MKVRAPGKIILSGEHAVVHGHPALVMAIDRYMTVSIQPTQHNDILLKLSDLGQEHRLPIIQLLGLKKNIAENYNQFRAGVLPIKKVLKNENELIHFALGLFLEKVATYSLRGMKIELKSTILPNAGMGSSAALIVSILLALFYYFEEPFTLADFYQMSLVVENLQHGFSSGLDLKASLQGGMLYFKNHTVSERMVPDFTFFLAYTGKSLYSTGECIEKTAPFFKKKAMGRDFEAVTTAFDQALALEDFQTLKHVMRENHRLLLKIGVVPRRVQAFVHSIEKNGGAAKISGAGSIAGDGAGIVIILMEEETKLQEISAAYHYPLQSVKGESRGAYVI